MKGKKKIVRTLSIILTLIMLISVLEPVNIFATETTNYEDVDLSKKDKKIDEYESVISTEEDLAKEELKTAILDMDSVPEAVYTDFSEEIKHVKRLYKQETDLNSIIFQNRDETKTMYNFTEPIKYIDENGNVKDKSNKISTINFKNKEFKNLQNFKYVNNDNDIKTYFPQVLSKDSSVLLDFYEQNIIMSPYKAEWKDFKIFLFDEKENQDLIDIEDEIEFELTDIKNEIEVDETLKELILINAMDSVAKKKTFTYDSDVSNKIKIEKDSIEYCGVFGDDTALRYSTQFNGLKEEVVLESYTGVNSFSFNIKTNGLALIEFENSYYLENPLTGEKIVKIGDIIIFDNVGEFGIGFMESEIIRDDFEYILTIVVDENYLTDKSRVWPVTIDPSFDIIVSGSGTSKTIQDVPIYSLLSPSISSGANELNIVGYVGNSLNGTPYGVGRTLMKFPGLINNDIFKGLNERITNISLKIRNGTGNSNSTQIMAFYYTGNSWNENTAKCSNISWYGHGAEITRQTITSAGWYTFNLTSAKDSWLNNSVNADKGIMFINTSETNGDLRKSLESTESSNKPYITVTWSNSIATGITSGQNYYIVNRNSRKVLEVWNKQTGNYSNVVQNQFAGGSNENQKWKITYLSHGYYTIRPTHNLAGALDVETSNGQLGANADTYNIGTTEPTNTGTYWYAQWMITECGTDSYYGKKYYKISSLCSNNLQVLTVQDASEDNGANVFQFDYNKTQNDEWYIIPASNYDNINSPSGDNSIFSYYSSNYSQTNCFGYAMGTSGGFKTPLWGLLPPNDPYDANLPGYFLARINYDINPMYKEIKTTFAMPARGLSSGLINGDLTVMAVKMNSNRVGDFHIMKLMSDGKWTHKMGSYTGIMKFKNSITTPWKNEAWDLLGGWDPSSYSYSGFTFYIYYSNTHPISYYF